MGTKERRMIRKRELLAAGAAMVLSVGAADAGAGPTPGYTGLTITTGDADVKSHPPTDTMNKVAGDRATSSQDTQKQQQGQPRAAQQAKGTKQTQTADQGC